MPDSQKSFEARLQRFKDGKILIDGWADYTPGNPDITTAALGTFITSVDAANTGVSDSEDDLNAFRADRDLLFFEKKDTNPLCFETRTRGILNYLRSDPNNTKFKSAAKNVAAIIKKIRPQYKKKAEGAPRGAGKSPSEKSFASAIGQCKKVIDIITKVGVSYTPPDANLRVPAMQTLLTNMNTANTNVANAMEDYGNANKTRKDLYDGSSGMEKRKSAILSYLASFPGLKKSSHYREFNQAIKGT